MTSEVCILTTKDFTILEVMRDRCLGTDDPLAPLLKRKIDSATVMFRDDLPENIATLSSRVTFTIDGGEPETRVISYDPAASPVGLFLPVTTLRGLALLGLTEGQEFHMPNPEGVEERITLEKVLYQPEAARREKGTAGRASAPAEKRPALRLIAGGYREQPTSHTPFGGPSGPDDPGPTAA